MESSHQQTATSRRRLLGSPYTVTLAVVLFVYVFFFPPGWLTDPEPARPIPPQQVDQALRFTLYVQAQKVEWYRSETGRLPDSLDEAGRIREKIDYTRRGEDAFDLAAEDRGQVLVYSSEVPAREFLGDAADFLDRETLQ
jgi:hypothetical protein